MTYLFNKKLFLIALVIFAGFGFVAKAEAATNVYYSVGQNVTDHKTGTPTLDIVSGVGTFDVAQTATNMGVGDKVTFNTSSICYISSKTSTSIWNLVTATGAACGDVTDATVDSITHSFASLNAAIGLGVTGNATSTDFMNTSNLVTGNFILNIPVYYDSGADTTAVNLSGYTTGASNYIKIYAPNNTTTEVNLSQRHSGVWSDTKFNLTYNATGGSTSALAIGATRVIIDGLQIAYSDTSLTTGNAIGISVTSANITISNSIIKKGSGTNARRGIYQSGFSSTLNIYNTLVYGFTGTSVIGIQTTGDGTQTTNIYSSTVVANTTAITTVDSATIKNVYAHGTTAAYSGTFAMTNAASSDATGSAGLQSIAYSTANFTNVTAGSQDLHIPSGSALINTGTDTSSESAPLNFTTDIDGENRTVGAWDIGADEYTTGADITAPTVDTFIIPATATSLTVSITDFTASDLVGVTGYMATTSSSAPLASDATWMASAPTTYTFTSAGTKTLYAWAKDAAGNVSTSLNDSVVITLAAEDFYITQDASGSDTGADCSNAHSAVWLNTASNWASPKEIGKIAPGDSAHLCGTFTGTAGQTMFTIPGSGSSGNPVTIVFETGSHLDAPYWGGASNGAITISGKNYITINGGTNGIIQNTANGTALANQQASQGIYINASTNIEVKNLTIQNIYANGGSDPSATDTAGTNTANIKINGSNTNISVHDNTLTAARVGIREDFDGAALDTVSFYNNTISDHGWGIMVGAGTGGETTTGINIYGNTFTDWTNWQCPANATYCNDKTDTYHTDGIILYSKRNSPITANIYNNYFYGTLGQGSPTAFIFCTNGGGTTGIGSTCNVFNNLLVETTGRKANWMMAMGGYTGNHQIYNNTLIGQDTTAGIAMVLSGTGLKVKNNLIVNKQIGISSYETTHDTVFSLPSDSDYNVWILQTGTNFKFDDGAINYSWAQWQALGYDSHSITTNPNLSASYYLQAGSSAIGLGADLTSVGISALNSDKNTSARPSGSVWDAGVYNYSVDNTAPSVTAFVIPATASSLTVDINTFTATDVIGVTGYKLTESETAPLSGDAGWTGSAPTTYTFSSAGAKTLYAWAKDAAGNVSGSLNDSVTITLPSSTKAITAFNFNGLTPAVIGSVNETDKTIALAVPYGTAVTALVPTITQTGSSISPASGVAQDFTTPATYTVTAANASTQAYLVTVTVGVAPAATPAPVSSGGSSGSPAIWTLPTVPLNGFKLTINSGALTTSNRNVFLGFNAGTDIKKMAISMTGDFTDASQENYVASKQWDLCSKLGGAIKSPTCPDGTYKIYAQFYTVYGRSSGNALASSTITLKSGSTTTENLRINNLPFTNPFAKYLQYRQTNADIKRLQIFLNSDQATQVAKSGAGSPGKETNYFGLLTYKAVIKFQEKYAKDVLAPWGFVKGTGYVGKTTLAKINELIGNK
jgi:hypothetical protein